MSRHVVCSALVVAPLTLAVCSSACVQTQDEHSPATQALANLRASAEAGDAEVQFILGGMYVTGVGVPPDAAEAVAWYRRAVEQGDARAQYNLGGMYREGRGVPQDAARAIAWYRRAAEQGHARAQYNLGGMYAEGLGVPRDAVEAHMWLTIACPSSLLIQREWYRWWPYDERRNPGRRARALAEITRSMGRGAGQRNREGPQQSTRRD